MRFTAGNVSVRLLLCIELSLADCDVRDETTVGRHAGKVTGKGQNANQATSRFGDMISHRM